MSLCLKGGQKNSHHCSVCGTEVYESKVLNQGGYVAIHFTLKLYREGTEHESCRSNYNITVCSLDCLGKIDIEKIREEIAYWENHFGHKNRKVEEFGI